MHLFDSNKTNKGLECAAWRPPRPVAQCRLFQEVAKDASVSECTWTQRIRGVA